MTDARERRAAEIQDAIRRILYQDWNPIGFDSLPVDEYDSYIVPIYRILAGGRSEHELVEFLFRTDEGIMGVSRAPQEHRDRIRTIASRLLEIDVRL